MKPDETQNPGKEVTPPEVGEGTRVVEYPPMDISEFRNPRHIEKAPIHDIPHDPPGSYYLIYPGAIAEAWNKLLGGDTISGADLHRPDLMRWYSGECMPPANKNTLIALIGDAVDPRKPGRRRWDVILLSRYIKEEVWRLDSITPDGNGFVIEGESDLGIPVRMKVSPLTQEWCYRNPYILNSDYVRWSLDVGKSESIFANSEKLRTMERRVEAVAIRGHHRFVPTQAMVDTFNEKHQEILEQPMLTLPILQSEPWGLFSNPPWKVGYSLRFFEGETVLCVAQTNRFTNDRFDFIFSDGSIHPDPWDWRWKWELFHSWSGETLKQSHSSQSLSSEDFSKRPPPPPLPISSAQESLVAQRRESLHKKPPAYLLVGRAIMRRLSGILAIFFAPKQPPTIRLQLYSRDRDHCISKYSIIDNLLYDLACDLPARELTPHERLYVIRRIGRKVHQGCLATLYVECGCSEQAMETYLQLNHPRKLGDICWWEGNLDEAEAWYLQIKPGGRKDRSSQQVDRLLKLAFYRERWDEVLPLFEATPFDRYSPPEKIFIGSFEASPKTSLNILAGALRKLGVTTPAPILKILEEVFGLTAQQWSEYLNDPAHHDEATMAQTKERCRPMICRTPLRGLRKALRLGKTIRAKKIISFIRSADQRIESAQRTLEEYARTGDQAALDRFLNLMTESGISTFTKAMLFAATGHGSYPKEVAMPMERRLRFYKSHPALEKHFRKDPEALAASGSG